MLIAPPSLLVHGLEESLLDRLQYLLEAHGLDSVSPNVYMGRPEMVLGLGPLDVGRDPPRLSVLPHDRGYLDATLNEVQLVAFRPAGAGWPCFHALLDPARNPVGWGTDLCYRRFCNATLGLADAAVIHFGRPSAYANLPGMIGTDSRTRMRQMLAWAERHVRDHRDTLPGWPADWLQITKRYRS